MFCVFVAVDLSTIDGEISNAIGSDWAASTLHTRNSQWKRYIDFCQTNHMIPLPAEATCQQ